MEPVIVSVEVARPRREVFEFVDAPANRERWMSHLFKDWRPEGPWRGVEWLKTPRTERIAAFVSRAFMRRANGRGMKRPPALLDEKG